MLTRLIAGLIGIAIVIPMVFYRGGLPFTILVGLAAILGLLEFYGGARRGGYRPNFAFGIATAVLLLCYGRRFGTDAFDALVPIFTAFLLLALAYELIRQQRAPFVNIGVTALGLGYVVWLLLHFVWLRMISGTVTVGGMESGRGAWLVMFVLLCTWATDTGAYFIGKFYGRKKLTPRLSPGKTVEGAVGGLALSIIVGAVTAAIIGIPQPHGLVLGAMIGITAQIGDLTGSAFKREVNIKDFGALIPGHGGILDRIDSLLFTGPITFWYITTALKTWLGS
ncbi:MAG TPA: phosphatidate cytidylyltransferase [Armatimonadota bacterium]|nr:phosphatidate cytidylyltransferase [Armatimonadota bacterium]HOP79280.1 phosphatidate cytidylyltransferase [Armatimonadota bacterium]HPP74428.1 phosphatidate cytidylyltransferase [Armatimonadota bacterium]